MSSSRAVARRALAWLVERTDAVGGAHRLPGANTQAAAIEGELVALGLAVQTMELDRRLRRSSAVASWRRSIVVIARKPLRSST